MANSFPLKKPAADNIVQMLAPASTAISIGDLIYMAASTFYATPASSQADKLTESANQAEFALRFIGISCGARLAADAVAGQLPVQTDGLVQLTCASDTFEIGDLVGASEAASGTALEPQTVEKVTNPRLAIGVVVQREASATTKVWVKLLSRMMDVANRADIGPASAGSATEVALADTATTLLVSQGPFFTALPTAARTHVLPPEAQSKGLVWYFANLAAATHAITINNPAAAAVVAIPATKRGVVWCDGVTWRGAPFA